MNKKELRQLIDLEVSKVFSDMTTKEPQSNKEVDEVKDVQSMSKKPPITEDELDEILFYGKQNKKGN
tara:strand:- start:762 stop:962 length:201 start_codon:yes stop_codon:yes gene_type:complete